MRYTDEEIKWFQNWEKNLDTTIKTIKKLKEDLAAKPEDLSAVTADKYRYYFDVIHMELLEVKQHYESMEPVRDITINVGSEDRDLQE